MGQEMAEVGQEMGEVGQEMGAGGGHSVFRGSYSRALGSLSWLKESSPPQTTFCSLATPYLTLILATFPTICFCTNMKKKETISIDVLFIHA